MSKETIVAITDAGGRGAALAEAYARSPHVDRILGFPGRKVWELDTGGKPVEFFPGLKTTSKEEILQICKDRGVTLLDVCQDNAVAVGLADKARERGILAIGPTRAAGQIEWDKVYLRRLGAGTGIAQPRYTVWESDFGSPADVLRKLDQSKTIAFLNGNSGEELCWVKAVGLAEGKGAIGARNRQEIVAAIERMKEFDDAGKRFLIEEWLRNDDGTPGEEFSYFVLCQGEDFVYLGSANDNKPIGNRDEGPNTGGMGGNNRPDILTRGLRQRTDDSIARLLHGLVLERRPYTGVLYFSGMRLHRNGADIPYCVETNARWGDPEAQIILPGIKNDWFETMMTLAEGGSLKNIKIENDGLKRVGVVVASLGYPGDYKAVKGKEIFGIEDVMKMDGVRLYGAGVAYDGQTFRADGGRLLTVVGEGEDITKARERAYAGVSHIIVGDNEQVSRHDIGWREVLRFQQAKKLQN